MRLSLTLNLMIMRVDWYTRSVLTIIAASLVMLVLQNMQLIPAAVANADQNAKAASKPAAVRLPVNEDGSVDVRLKGGLSDKIMDVNIVRVSGTEARKGLPVRPFDHSLNVNLEELGGYQVYGTLPVEMK